MRRTARWFGIGLAWFLLAIASLSAMAALYFDLSFSKFRVLTPILYLVVLVVLVYFARRSPRRMAVCLAGFLILLVCWLAFAPTLEQPELASRRLADSVGRN